MTAKSQGRTAGWFYLIFGGLMVWSQVWIMRSQKGRREPYTGYNLLQLLWLIFGIGLVIGSLYILSNSK